MLTAEENERLTRVGPGTPMGELQRRYWHPIAGTDEMADRWTKRVRLLGEDLVLYQGSQRALGLIGEFCPHRRASLAYGIPTDDGIRCPYHGWKFDARRALPRAAERTRGPHFKDKVATRGLSGRSARRDACARTSGRSRRRCSRAGTASSTTRDPHHRPGDDPVQLAADHGELARSGPHRVAAWRTLRVRQRSRRDEGRELAHIT